MNLTTRIEFAASAINSIGEKLKYNCAKKKAENENRKMRYFFMERRGWANRKISQVNIVAFNIAVINSVIIKTP